MYVRERLDGSDELFLCILIPKYLFSWVRPQSILPLFPIDLDQNYLLFGGKSLYVDPWGSLPL